MISQELAMVDEARRALAQIETVDDAKALRDKAEAARIWAKNARLGLEAQNHCAEVKLYAERKAGELLATTARPGNPQLSQDGTIGRLPEGVTRNQSSRWQALARIPEPEFTKAIEDAKDSGQEVTTGAMLRQARRNDRPLYAAPAPTTGTFHVVYADPPWRYEHAISTSREIENQYPTMTLDEIKALNVPAADDSVLFLWATSPKLAESIEVMEAWGFDYRTCLVWVKDRIGMGYYARQQHELLLVGRRGSLPVPTEDARPSSVIQAPRGTHSAKPELVYGLLERMYPTHTRVELFARSERPGWAAWGNQVAA